MGRRFIIAALTMCLPLSLASCDSKQSERDREAEARRQAEVARQCELVNGALAVVGQRGRKDLTVYDLGQPCERIQSDDCDYKVELMFELTKAGQAALSDQITPLGPDCAEEQKFALKYGLEAFRDHRKLLNDAVEEATEPREPEPPDR